MSAAVSGPIEAQLQAIDCAIARGDLAEEAARQRALEHLRQRARSSERAEGDSLGVILRMQRAATQRGRTSWLAKLASRRSAGLSEAHLRAAMLLREHVEGAISASCELAERVDGGRLHNGQMEGLVDRRSSMRYALNAAAEAITDDRMVRPALTVILRDCSPRAACKRWGVPWQGRMQGRIVGAIAEALDAAAAHIGVSR
jgi:hypothetical protein